MRTLAAFLGGAACVGLVVGALAVAGVIDGDSDSAPTSAAPPPAATPATVAAIYRRVSPAVVFVQANSGRGRLPFPGGGRAASGSGFVVDTAGHVVTNEHVVAGANRFRVRFGDKGRPVKATLVGKDASSDLAVLKTRVPDGVKPLDLGDLSTLVPG